MSRSSIDLRRMSVEDRRNFRDKYEAFFFDMDAFVAMSRSSIDLRRMSVEDRRNFRDKYEAFFFDMDGTLKDVRMKVIPGVPEALSALAALGKELYLFTDNCLYQRSVLAKSIRKAFPQFKEENVITSVWLLTKHLKEIGFNRKIYAIGDRDGLVQELKNAGFQVESDDEVRKIGLEDIIGYEFDPEVGAVVLCTDLNISYIKYFKSVNYLKNPDVLYFISNPIASLFDPKFPVSGSLSLPIEKVSGRKPTTCGKGSPASVEYIRSLGHDMNSCLFVGDGLENDIACGNLSGMDTLLVLSGSDDLDDVAEARVRGDHHRIPTYFADSLAVLADIYSL